MRGAEQTGPHLRDCLPGSLRLREPAALIEGLRVPGLRPQRVLVIRTEDLGSHLRDGIELRCGFRRALDPQ
jgi:hypothetical protein